MKTFYTLVSIMAVCTLLTAQKAPDFTITDYNGEVHKLYEDYLDQDKVVMLKIMFVACPPCNTAAPAVQDLYEFFGEGQEDVEFFDLSNKSWDDNNAVEGFAERHSLTFTGAGVDGGALTAVDPYVSGTFGRFRGTPTFVVIDADGNVDFDVPLSTLKQSIENALEGEGGCASAFGGQISGVEEDVTISLKSDVVGSQVYHLNPLGDPEYSYECEFPFPAQALEYYIDVEKDGNDLQGVSTKDIVFTVRHLLGIAPFTTSEEKIAADFTANDVISARDISEMRKLILGVNNENQDHDSWRFWSVETDFSNDTTGILIPDLIERVSLMEVVDSMMSGDFAGVKLGDVSGDINMFFGPPNQTRSKLELTYNDVFVNQGEKVSVQLFTDETIDLSSIQQSFSINGNELTIEYPLGMEGFSHVKGQTISSLAYAVEPVEIEKNKAVLTLQFRASGSGYISELIQEGTTTPLLAMVNNDQEVGFSVLPDRSIDPLTVTPNPFSDVLQLSGLGLDTRVTLYNGHGQVVRSIVSNGPQLTLDVTDLGSGAYLLRIENNEVSVVRKLLKP